MKIERFEKIKNLYLVKDNEEAIIVKKNAKLSILDIKKQFAKEKKPIDQQRKQIFKSQVAETIKIKPFEMKQYFLKNGDIENSNKAINLASENAVTNLKQIKNELTFFGQSFLEGFVSVFGIKMDKALDRYENNFMIIEEEELETGRKESFIVKFKDGVKRGVTPPIETMEKAREQLEIFYNNNKEKKRMVEYQPKNIQEEGSNEK